MTQLFYRQDARFRLLRIGLLARAKVIRRFYEASFGFALS
jgi:hypothetical protein